MKRFFFYILVLFLVGCGSSVPKVPNVGMKNFVYKRTDPLGGTTIKAAQIIPQPNGGAIARGVSWDTQYPSFSVSASAEEITYTPEEVAK